MGSQSFNRKVTASTAMNGGIPRDRLQKQIYYYPGFVSHLRGAFPCFLAPSRLSAADPEGLGLTDVAQGIRPRGEIGPFGPFSAIPPEAEKRPADTTAWPAKSV